MNYQSYDYETDNDAAPWTASAVPAQPVSTPVWNNPATYNQMIAAPPNAQLVPAPAPVLAANTSEVYVLGSMLQSVQQLQRQQLDALRDFDYRIGRLERAARPAPQPVTPSFERATWWAIWGLLMLILGGALAVVIVLILLNIQFR
jgi:hypothetical protein